MRNFTREHAYDAPAAEVVLLWRDPAFLAAVGDRFGGIGKAEIDESGDRVVVTTHRELPLDKVPSFVRRFIQSGMLEQRDDWPKDPGSSVDGSIEGKWTVTGKMPATMSGRQSVQPVGDGCTVTVSGSVDVSAPLVAGKIEELISREITKLIGVQQEFAEEWLAGKRPDATKAP